MSIALRGLFVSGDDTSGSGMSFWESFADCCDAAFSEMGEPERVEIDGQPVDDVIVNPMTIDRGLAPGGMKTGVLYQLFVSAASVTPRDGMPVKARGIEGRVSSWDRFSATHLMLEIGPVNRWSGDVPGL